MGKYDKDTFKLDVESLMLNTVSHEHILASVPRRLARYHWGMLILIHVPTLVDSILVIFNQDPIL